MLSMRLFIKATGIADQRYPMLYEINNITPEMRKVECYFYGYSCKHKTTKRRETKSYMK